MKYKEKLSKLQFTAKQIKLLFFTKIKKIEKMKIKIYFL